MNDRKAPQRRLRTVETKEQHEDLVLERKASGEVLDELLVMEMELLRRYKAHLAAKAAAQATAPAPAPAPAKSRIVEKLRKLD